MDSARPLEYLSPMPRARSLAILLAAATCVHAAEALGQQQVDTLDNVLVLGLGTALDTDVGDGSTGVGADVFVEFHAIDDWLEIEVGGSVLASGGGTEMPFDLLFKKPFRLARWAEMMIGVGPEVLYARGTRQANGVFFGGEFVVDFMFWWSRHVGWSVEPSYDVVARNGVTHGPGISAGLIVGW